MQERGKHRRSSSAICVIGGQELAIERTRTISWKDPRQLVEAGRGLSGLEFLQKIVSGELSPPPLAALMDFDLVELREGYAVFAIDPAEYLATEITGAAAASRYRRSSCS